MVCTDYKIKLSYKAEEPDWDAFLVDAIGGHHLQTSLWGQLKAFSGWRAARIIVTRGEQIVAGAQLLMRPLPLIGNVCYVPKGPLFTSNDPELRNLFIDKLQQMVKTHRIVYLIVQPPCNDEAFAHQLTKLRFQQSKNRLFITATLLVDLTMDLDKILAQMRKKTRQHIRVGQRKGISVREGTESDLHTFHHLLGTAGKRLKFSPDPEEYFRTLWRLFNPHGYVKLFLAEYKGEAVSALLTIPFGDTVLCKRIGWSGDHLKRYPNELLHWATIKWAKSKGYRSLDFEGVDLKVARTLLSGEPLPDETMKGATFFKLGFGGRITLFPEAYDYIPNPILRLVYTRMFPKIVNSSLGTKAYRYIRHLLKK